MKYRALFTLCVLALGIACSSPKNAPPAPTPRAAENVPKVPAPVPEAQHDALEERVFEWTNRERQRQGRSPDARIARGHRRLIGLTAENLWMGSGYASFALDDIAATMIESWLKSPGHRRNLLNPEYTHLGVGIARANGEVRATQCFSFSTAYLDTPLPPAITSGQPLDLRAKTAAANLNAPVQVAFRNTSGREAGPVALGEAVRIDLAEGSYRLLFYTPDSQPRRYTLYFGPSLEVR